MTAKWTSRDFYVPRPEVPGHRMHTESEGRLLRVVCECGWKDEPMHLSNVIGAENRHRIEAKKEVPTVSLRDENLRVALLKAFGEWVDAELTSVRAAHRDTLVERYQDEGTKSFDVKLPDGTKVATISLSIPKDHIDVTDPDALIEWGKANDPTIVTTVDHPAVPAHTTVELDLKRVAELIGRAKSADGVVVDPDTGTVIDGLTFRPGGPPKSYAVKYTDDGREHIGTALRAGELAHLVAGTPLAIGGQS